MFDQPAGITSVGRIPQNNGLMESATQLEMVVQALDIAIFGDGPRPEMATATPMPANKFMAIKDRIDRSVNRLVSLVDSVKNA